jgi:hypothetical protein
MLSPACQPVPEPSPAVWEWAAQHPPLQHLHVDAREYRGRVPGWQAWEQAGQQLMARRPGLAVDVYDSVSSTSRPMSDDVLHGAIAS